VAEPKFEKLLEELERLVAELEEGDLGLDDALKKYEAGVKAYKKCRALLEKAERKIEILFKDQSGELTRQEFKPGGDNSGDS